MTELPVVDPADMAETSGWRMQHWRTLSMEGASCEIEHLGGAKALSEQHPHF